ncbi:MAG: potassium-transporting ATPase subunit F [Planctomycetia bacterium]|nr:potassium-transporting ATPase subunit F [Planctomycetia bacterium]
MRRPAGAEVMTLVIATILTIGLLVYLTWAMLRPEDF